MIFTAYVDESGMHDGSQHIVLAGYISTADQWNAFEDNWKAALSDAGIPSFHMTDFANRIAPHYNRWSESQRQERLARFINIANKHSICSVGVILSKADLGAAMGRVITVFRGRAYGIAATWFTGLTVAALTKHHDPNAHVAYVMDRGARRSGEYVQIINRMMAKTDLMAGIRALSIRLESSSLFVPLQAADILAYELYRLAGSSGDKPKRTPLTLLHTDSSYWFHPTGAETRELMGRAIPKFEYLADLIERRKRLL